MLVERVERFVRDPLAESFGELALEAFAFQYRRIASFRQLCDRTGRTPGVVTRWQDIPLVPTLAYKSLELCADEPRERFRSSGTSSAARSVHLHPYPHLYRATIDASFPAAALPGVASRADAAAGRLPILSLVPAGELMPDSSLSFMIDHVIDRWGDPSSLCAIGERGVEARRLRAWLAGRQRDTRPVLLLTTALALLDALEALDRLGLRFRLPSGTVLFETGGYKGKVRQSRREELEPRVEAALGIPPQRILREYGMTELTSQLYTRLAGDAVSSPPRFFAPHWVRVRVLDPRRLEPLPEGEVGMVAILDVANLGSAVHVLTEDLGVLAGGGLDLRGRASGSEPRGCSLTAEELTAASP